MGLSLDRRSELWTVRPLELPRLRRYCPGCGVAREFVCSGRFRTNAQKKAIDVWLKYRCALCETVWKAPVIARRPISQLDPTLREGFERDDQALVWKYAFDTDRWRSHVIAVEADVPLRVDRAPVECACDASAHACFHLAVPFPCELRLDRLLSTELRIARAQLQRWRDSGRLDVEPEQRDALRKRVRDGQCVRFREEQDATLSSRACVL